MIHAFMPSYRAALHSVRNSVEEISQLLTYRPVRTFPGFFRP